MPNTAAVRSSFRLFRGLGFGFATTNEHEKKSEHSRNKDAASVNDDRKSGGHYVFIFGFYSRRFSEDSELLLHLEFLLRHVLLFEDAIQVLAAFGASGGELQIGLGEFVLGLMEFIGDVQCCEDRHL